MQNAHERFGTLEIIKRTKDTTTRVRVYIDRVVLETAKDERSQAATHLVSMIGGDAEIGALWAAVPGVRCSIFNSPVVRPSLPLSVCSSPKLCKTLNPR
jgi:hypothetical protein